MDRRYVNPMDLAVMMGADFSEAPSLRTEERRSPQEPLSLDGSSESYTSSSYTSNEVPNAPPPSPHLPTSDHRDIHSAPSQPHRQYPGTDIIVVPSRVQKQQYKTEKYMKEKAGKEQVNRIQLHRCFSLLEHQCKRRNRYIALEARSRGRGPWKMLKPNNMRPTGLRGIPGQQHCKRNVLDTAMDIIHDHDMLFGTVIKFLKDNGQHRVANHLGLCVLKSGTQYSESLRAALLSVPTS